MSSPWVYQCLKEGQFHIHFTPTHEDGNGSYAADGNPIPVTPKGFSGNNLVTPTDVMWWIQLQNQQQKEAPWWSNGRFRIRDSCGLCFKGRNGKYTFPLSSKRSLKSVRSVCVLFPKMQSNRRSWGFVWCKWTTVYSQTNIRCARPQRGCDYWLITHELLWWDFKAIILLLANYQQWQSYPASEDPHSHPNLGSPSGKDHQDSWGRGLKENLLLCH